jgi:glutaredoxin
MQVELYTRNGCHLCEDALDILRSYGLDPEVTDIDTRPDLLASYNKCVPVVVMDGKVRFRGRIERALLERLLANRD